jgi:fructoselysine-6-P-deglycase FrlB-like protein
LVVAISRTGGTTEVQLAVGRLRALYNARALAVTGEVDSPLGSVCDAETAFTECYEQSIVMTQAFTCMLTGLYLIADGSMGWPGKREISRIPGLIATSLRDNEETLRTIAEDERIIEFFYLGSGVMKGLADECALKMTEMALLPAAGHRSLEFRHGPKAALDEQSQVVIFQVAAERPHLETLLGEVYGTGARTLLVGSPVEGNTNRYYAIELGTELPEVFRPALYAHVGQLLACLRATSKGLDPHSPRHLARTVLLDV